MEKDGLVIRKDLSGRLLHAEYFVSDPLGFAVLHLISTLTRWGREDLFTRPTHRNRLDNPRPRLFVIEGIEQAALQSKLINETAMATPNLWGD